MDKIKQHRNLILIYFGSKMVFSSDYIGFSCGTRIPCICSVSPSRVAGGLFED
jgi:hypothetical protein